MTDTERLLSAGTQGVPWMQRIEQHPHWDKLNRLPVMLATGIPLAHFTVRDLLLLEQGQMLTSRWTTIEDVPLKIGAVILSWSEFEVVDQKMAVRLTRLG